MSIPASCCFNDSKGSLLILKEGRWESVFLLNTIFKAIVVCSRSTQWPILCFFEDTNIWASTKREAVHWPVVVCYSSGHKQILLSLNLSP